jgi:hypothetical protein
LGGGLQYSSAFWSASGLDESNEGILNDYELEVALEWKKKNGKGATLRAEEHMSRNEEDSADGWASAAPNNAKVGRPI